MYVVLTASPLHSFTTSLFHPFTTSPFHHFAISLFHPFSFIILNLFYLQKGRILQSTGSWYLIQLEDNTEVVGRLRGKLKLADTKTTNPVAVGDWVTCELETSSEAWIISEILPRHNAIIRKSPRKQHHTHTIAANIDQVLLLITFSRPRTSFGFVDRFLTVAEYDEIPTVLVFNKQDLYDDEDLELYNEAKTLYQSLGYECLLVSAETGYGIDQLNALIANKTNLLVGYSGVGKSTLLNYLHPNVKIRTQVISDYSDKGQHTTTAATMYYLASGAAIIDTPGIKMLELVALAPEQVGFYFREIKQFAKQCKYSNCMHLDEPKCAVKEAVRNNLISDRRYASYVKIVTDIESINYWERM